MASSFSIQAGYPTKGGNSARVFSKEGTRAQGLGTVGGLGFEFGARSLLEENWRQPYEGASQYSGALGLARMRIYTLYNLTVDPKLCPECGVLFSCPRLWAG